jgi:hypothetical protein
LQVFSRLSWLSPRHSTDPEITVVTVDENDSDPALLLAVEVGRGVGDIVGP